MTKYEKALDFATRAHGDQKRKYTNEPYINHPVAVAAILKAHNYHEDVLVAALLHDVVEDTPVTLADIHDAFGGMIAHLVESVTDVYTSEAFPHLNRNVRKKMECVRLSTISGVAKCIKLADLIDNTSSIVEYDAGFAKVYLKEKEEMLKILTGGDANLMMQAVDILRQSKIKLGIYE